MLLLAHAVKTVPHQSSDPNSSGNVLAATLGTPSNPQPQAPAPASLSVPTPAPNVDLSQASAWQTVVNAINTTNAQSLFVLLAVNINENYRMAQIKTNCTTDDDSFFHEFRQEYARLRGLVRHLLSIWRYAGAEFVRVLNASK